MAARWGPPVQPVLWRQGTARRNVCTHRQNEAKATSRAAKAGYGAAPTQRLCNGSTSVLQAESGGSNPLRCSRPASPTYTVAGMKPSHSGRDVIRWIERIAQFGGPGEAGTSHTKAATATTVATHRKGAATYDFLGEMVYRPQRNVAAPCALLADLTPPPAHRRSCAPVPRHEQRADEKWQALSCWLHLTDLDWGASTHTDTKIHSTFLL